MVERRTCSFCGNDIEPGTGKMFIKKDGTVFYFCQNKCQKNLLKLGRVPHRTRWTTRYGEMKAVRLAPERKEKAEKKKKTAKKVPTKKPVRPPAKPEKKAPVKKPVKPEKKAPVKKPVKPEKKAPVKKPVKPSKKKEPEPKAEA